LSTNDLGTVLKQGLLEKGLTEDEANMVTVWVQDGKPGLSQHRAERLGEIYCLGYSCQELRKWMPEYPLEVLLWARVNFAWDELRAKYRQVVQQETLNAALAARMESIRFLSDALTATHIKWRKEILAYIQEPEKYEKPPKILPDNLHTYGFLINILKDITTPFQTEAKSDDKSVQLVSVNINNAEAPSIEVKKATKDDIKNALLDEVRRKHGKD
jgi:hypothetical protein